MSHHIKVLSSSCFYHIRSFRQIRPSLDDSMAASVASALIYRALISWTPSCTALRLSTQLASNVFSMQWLGLLCTGSLAHLHSVHCLQPNFSINHTGFLLNGEYSLTGHFDLQSFAYWSPPYLSDLLQYHEPTRSLRSSSSHQLSVPRHNLTFGSRAFRFSAPRVWNSLPVSSRETKSLHTFRRHSSVRLA